MMQPSATGNGMEKGCTELESGEIEGVEGIVLGDGDEELVQLFLMEGVVSDGHGVDDATLERGFLALQQKTECGEGVAADLGVGKSEHLKRASIFGQ